MDILKRRLNLLESDDVPTKSELRDQMKNMFSEIILQTMNPQAQKIMGYNEFLKGPSNLLWISPENHLKLNVKITEQKNENCLKILTSDGIEQLGSQIDSKMNKNIMKKIQRALDSQECIYKKHCINCIKEAIDHEVNIHTLKREDIKKQYIDLFKTEYESMKSKFKEERQKISLDLENSFKRKCKILLKEN